MSLPIPPPRVWPDDVPDRKAAQRLGVAVALSSRVEVCEALLAGVPVPARRLDPAWVRALGLEKDVVLDEALVMRILAHGTNPGKEVAR